EPRQACFARDVEGRTPPAGLVVGRHVQSARTSIARVLERGAYRIHRHDCGGRHVRYARPRFYEDASRTRPRVDEPPGAACAVRGLRRRPGEHPDPDWQSSREIEGGALTT